MFWSNMLFKYIRSYLPVYTVGSFKISSTQRIVETLSCIKRAEYRDG